MQERIEEWRQIDDTDYEVSDRGRVRRMSTGRVLKPQTYVRVQLTVDGKNRQRQVHDLVARAFLGEPPSERHTPNHKNGDHADNSVGNLEWLTPREQQKHAIDAGIYSGKGEDAGRAILTEPQVRDIRARYTGAWGEQTALAREFGVSQALISKIVRGEVWGHIDHEVQSNVGPRGSAKLTREQVIEIRRTYQPGYGSQARLAERYGVSTSVIHKVVNYKTWKDVRPRGVAGDRHGQAKLTSEQVREIRALAEEGISFRHIADDYGVTRVTIRNIIERKTWRHIE